MDIEKLDKLHFITKCLILNSKNEFLILKRSNYKNNGTENLWDVPGGNVEIYEDVNDAILREIKEETNLELKNIDLVGVNSKKRGDFNEEIIFVLYSSNIIENDDLEIILSEEHTEYTWINFNQLENYKVYLSEDKIEMMRKYFEKLD